LSRGRGFKGVVNYILDQAKEKGTQKIMDKQKKSINGIKSDELGMLGDILHYQKDKKLNQEIRQKVG
jgi:hypothetical protein